MTKYAQLFMNNGWRFMTLTVIFNYAQTFQSVMLTKIKLKFSKIQQNSAKCNKI